MKELVTTDWLAEHLAEPDLVIMDVRWVADDPEGGRTAYLECHLPGARLLDLDADLSDRSDLSRGRHPLPDPAVFVRTLAAAGIGKGSRVVAYDDSAGSIAARLWWMLRWLGVDSVSVLDGGIQKWLAGGRATESGTPGRPLPHPRPLDALVNDAMAASMAEVESNERLTLIDARATERFRGEIEPIDTRAGHIPGAVNLPFADNLTGDSAPVFRDRATLSRLFNDAGVDQDSDIVCYCGSGVTACHDILALELAGYQRVRLYPGSWSEWIRHHDA